ncbi:hypothetical protein J2Y38_003701 [Flavobacterium sp. 2755]|nr:hypothetical protein [Flavobacterium sp. 2755]
MDHIFSRTLGRFICGIGGIFRWCFFQLLNILIEEKFPKELDYYWFNDDTTVDKNGFTAIQKNYMAGIILFIIFIFLIKILE